MWRGARVYRCRDECFVTLPNAVSPNGDGFNDDLLVMAPGCGSIESVILMDKWGNVLYQSTALSHNLTSIPASVWVPLPSNVYMIQVSYRNQGNRLKYEAGSVTLIR